ncbi:MAG TPA: hypothetical protein VMI75_22120 [Polyangiaceae bacterium]|nr:hypothetical protein [Polyangiaceae bacterium]
MRSAGTLVPLLLASACGVPEVSFSDDGGQRDARLDTGIDVAQDATSMADGEGGPPGDAGDAGTDAPIYCMDGGGPPDASPDASYTCCPSGAVCSGTCKSQACNHCGTCTWPSVCCPSGNNGKCTAPDAGPC